MNRQNLLFCILWLLTGCGGPVATSPAASATNTPPSPTATGSPGVIVTVVRGTGTASATAVSSPGAGTAIPTAILSTTATAAPAGSVELKYLLLDRFGDIFYCDPDFYPVARDEGVAANERFPVVQQDQPTFQGILKHLKIDAATSSFDASQKLIIYHEYKRLNAIALQANGDAYTFSLRVPGKDPNSREGMAISGTITKQGAITVTSSQPAILQCPICLVVGTLIDGPSGPLAVERLKIGDVVWTMDGAGQRIAAPVVSIGNTPVPATHAVVHLQLSDGREVWVSPGHPTSDRRLVGDLQVGDMLDGAILVGVQREPYAGGYTYDLLPAGDTGTYWANGVLLASTLRGAGSR